MLTPVVADFNHANPIGQGLGGEAAGFRAMRAAGIVGVIMKVRQGIGFADPAYQRRRQMAKDAGLKVGGYDFATHDDPVENAKDFLDSAQFSDDEIACLDFEDNRASQMNGDQARAFLDSVDQKRGIATWLYGGNRIFEQISILKMTGDDADWWARHPLWLCQYKTDPSFRETDLAALKPHLRIPRPWSAFTLFQYTGDGIGPLPHTAPGLENGADLNVFDGTADELRAIWPGNAPAVA